MPLIPLKITLPWPPTTGNHQYILHGRMRSLKPEIKAYREEIRWLLLQQRAAKRFSGPLFVTFRLFPPDRLRRDSDNHLKVVCDAMTIGGAWIDDSNHVISKTLIEWFDPVDKTGKIEIEIEGV